MNERCAEVPSTALMYLRMLLASPTGDAPMLDDVRGALHALLDAFDPDEAGHELQSRRWTPPPLLADLTRVGVSCADGTLQVLAYSPARDGRTLVVWLDRATLAVTGVGLSRGPVTHACHVGDATARVQWIHDGARGVRCELRQTPDCWVASFARRHGVGEAVTLAGRRHAALAGSPVSRLLLRLGLPARTRLVTAAFVPEWSHPVASYDDGAALLEHAAQRGEFDFHTPVAHRRAS